MSEGPRKAPPFEMSPEYENEVRRQVKGELRKRMKAVRKAMPHETRLAKSRLICENLTKMDAWKNARIVAMYLAMHEEVHLTFAMDVATAEKKIIALPRVDDATNTLTLHVWNKGDAMESSAFGVTEPLPSAPRVAGDEVDLVIVPALAIDERGHRIGYGAGYYDGLLPSLMRAVRVGVAFDFQLIAEAPNQANDVPLKYIVSEARVLAAT